MPPVILSSVNHLTTVFADKNETVRMRSRALEFAVGLAVALTIVVKRKWKGVFEIKREALGVSVLKYLTPLAGVVFSIPVISNTLRKANPFAACVIWSFVFFLLLFESMHLVATNWNEKTNHVTILWYCGTLILIGLNIPIFVKVIGSHMKHEHINGGRASEASSKGPVFMFHH